MSIRALIPGWKGCLLALVFAPFLFTASLAQTADTPPAKNETATAAELERLVNTLEDEGRRKTLINDLKALIAAQKETAETEEPPVGAWLLDFLSAKIDQAGNQLGGIMETLLDLPRLFNAVVRGLSTPEQRSDWLWLIAKLAAILASGLVAQMIMHRLLRRPYESIESQTIRSTALRVFYVLLRTMLDVACIAAFLAAAYGVMTLLDPVRQVRVVALALINAIVASRAVLLVARTVFAPQVAQLRLFTMGDETANYGFLWCRRLTYLTVYGFFGIEALLALGMSRGAHDLLLHILGLAICLLLIMLVLQNRASVAAAIRGNAGPVLGQIRRRLADVWHLLAIVYLITIYGVWSLEVPGGFEFIIRATVISFLIVVVAHGVVLILGRAIRTAFSLSEEQKQRFPGLEARANRYLPVVLGVSRFLIYAIAAIAFLQTWGLTVIDWFSTPLGTAVLARLTTIALIVVVAMAVWEFISAMIERYLEAKDEDGQLVHRGQRVQTLLPLLRNIVLIVIAVMVTLTVLSELGVDTGPLIAGAGILGLAIGFGAQTFVKDVITGFFILVEDSVAVGDLVEVGGHRGKVEAMSIRSIQLRDIRGDVHRVPFSEVTTTVNRSKVFSFAFFDVGVAYREDVDHCMNVIREIGDEMKTDPTFAPDILEAIEIMGLESFGDSAIVIRTRIKVKPGRQRGIQRAFNRLLKKRFDAEGIEIPFPHRTIYFGVDSQGDAPPAHIQMLGDARPPAPRDRRPPAELTKPPEGEQPGFEEETVEEEPEKSDLKEKGTPG